MRGYGASRPGIHGPRLGRTKHRVNRYAAGTRVVSRCRGAGPRRVALARGFRQDQTHGRAVMRRLDRSALLAAAIIVAGCLATVCVQAAGGAVIRSSPSAGAPTTGSAPPSPTPAPPSPTPTAASPTAAPSTAPASSSPASSSGSSSNLIWLGVILGALALLGIILWTTRSPARSSAAAGWRSRAADAYAKGGALDGAVDAQRAPGGASAMLGGPLHSRLLTLESSLNALRVPDDRFR